MTWKELIKYWLTGEIPEAKERKMRLDALWQEYDRCMREASLARQRQDQHAAIAWLEKAGDISSQANRISQGKHERISC